MLTPLFLHPARASPLSSRRIHKSTNMQCVCLGVYRQFTLNMFDCPLQACPLVLFSTLANGTSILPLLKAKSLSHLATFLFLSFHYPVYHQAWSTPLSELLWDMTTFHLFAVIMRIQATISFQRLSNWPPCLCQIQTLE